MQNKDKYSEHGGFDRPTCPQICLLRTLLGILLRTLLIIANPLVIGVSDTLVKVVKKRVEDLVKIPSVNLLSLV
jgi:hypothetical protein